MQSVLTDPADGNASPVPGSVAQRRYVLALMALVTASQTADRQILALVVEPVKAEFALSDAQMGLLTGTVFGIAYAIGVVPFALLADRWSRKKVIAATLAFWSAATAATAGMTSYVQLLIARTMVGLGEAGAGPAQLALLSTRYPPDKRAGMVAVITAVAAATGFAAFWSAGFVVERFGWREMFLVFGLPGLLLAVLIWTTIAEPRPRPAARSESLSVRELRAILFRAPMLHLFAAATWSGVVAAGTTSWVGAFLVREYGLPMSDVGFWMGLLGLTSGLLGALIGGYIANRLMARDLRGGLRLALVAMVAYVPLHAIAYLTTDTAVTLSLLLASSLVFGIYSAPLSAQFMNFMPERSRATAMAVLSMGILFLSGFGATLVGVLSDFASARGAHSGLRSALFAVALLGVLPILHVLGILRRASTWPSAQDHAR